MPRDNDRSHLHPTLRAKLVDLDAQLWSAGIPLELYEGGRSPVRQAELYARGRGVGPTGKTVTRARAFESFHQFGCAVDYVFRLNGAWTWGEPERGQWVKYQTLARTLGLRTLDFERPHVELPVSLHPMQAGQYPPGGDVTWRNWLENEIERWGQDARIVGGITHPGAPPLEIERPAEVA